VFKSFLLLFERNGNFGNILIKGNEDKLEIEEDNLESCLFGTCRWYYLIRIIYKMGKIIIQLEVMKIVKKIEDQWRKTWKWLLFNNIILVSISKKLALMTENNSINYTIMQ
jgi:hypothetical protein